MCGIFGYINYSGNGKKLLQIMAQKQIHRGPDSEGFFIDKNFGFGIRRLSIIDLVTGDQPISNEDKSIWIVCNGEIFNYLELIFDLKKRGHKFYTKSDAECVVHLYEEYGIDCLKHLNGMFGLALYDKKKNLVFIARDRIGIKPLYYSAESGYFLFSSELRSLLASNLINNDLDWNYLSFFLDKMYIPTPGTPFKSIFKLKPGHYLKIHCDSAELTDNIYWRLEDPPAEPVPKTEDEIIDKLLFLLKDSTKLCLRADVPLCVFLSGGIDSSAVTAFAAMETSKPLRTYHVYYKNASQKMDERKYADSVAKRYGTIHSEVTIDREDFNRLIPKLIYHMEEPFGDLAMVPMYIISKMARQEVKVCLNGSGGDELFAGYPYHNRWSPIKGKLTGLIDNMGLNNFVRTILGKSNLQVKWSDVVPGYVNKFKRIFPEDKAIVFKSDRINKILARDIDGYLQSNVLILTDKITMSVSLEGRVPLLDHRFVEMASHLPSHWKYKKGERKYIFKKLLEPFLPHDVLYRHKEGFGAPLNDWLDNNMRNILKDVVLKGALKKNEIINFNKIFIEQLNNWDLWKIACFELWYKIVYDGSEYSDRMQLKDFI